MFPAGISVTQLVRTRTGADAEGNDVWSSASVTITGCLFVPGTSTENVQGQDVVSVQPILHLPTGTVVGPYDAFVVYGTTYEVNGTSNAPQNPFTGWRPAVKVSLKEVTG